jgi:hypothetical protein
MGKGAFEFRQYGVHSSQRIVPPLNSAIDFFSLSFLFPAPKFAFPHHSNPKQIIPRFSVLFNGAISWNFPA